MKNTFNVIFKMKTEDIGVNPSLEFQTLGRALYIMANQTDQTVS